MWGKHRCHITKEIAIHFTRIITQVTGGFILIPCCNAYACVTLDLLLGSLRSNDGDGNRNATKTKGLISKKNAFFHAFL